MGEIKTVKPYRGIEKNPTCFFHPSSLYLLVRFQGLSPHFVLFLFCWNTGAESQQLPHTSPSHSKECSMHSLSLRYFPWLQCELEDLQELQTWPWRMIYDSYIYFPLVFVYLETFTGLSGRSMRAHVHVHVCLPQDDRLMAASCSFRHGKNAQQEEVPTVKRLHLNGSYRHKG